MKTYYQTLLEKVAEWFMQLFFDPMYQPELNGTGKTNNQMASNIENAVVEKSSWNVALPRFFKPCAAKKAFKVQVNSFISSFLTNYQSIKSNTKIIAYSVRDNLTLMPQINVGNMIFTS